MRSSGNRRKKSASLSLASLFSSLTNSSAASHSTTESSSRPKTRRSDSKTSKSTDGQSQVPAKPVRPPVQHTKADPVRSSAARKSPPMSPLAEHVDVFKYLEQDGATENGDTTPKAKSPGPHPLGSRASTPNMVGRLPTPVSSGFAPAQKQQGSPDSFELRYPAPARAQSFNTDSGISVRSHSSTKSTPVTTQKPPRKQTNSSMTMVRESSRASHGSKRSRNDRRSSAKTSPLLQMKVLESDPESFYGRVAISFPPQIEAPVAQKQIKMPRLPSYASTPPTQQVQPLQLPQPLAISPHLLPTYPVPRDPANGYDLLASKISSTGSTPLKPIYRRFETLHNRMLLYLQDQISELEDELKRIDHAVMETENVRVKASRRREVRVPSQLQFARIEITGRIMGVMETYNRGLSMYANLSKNLGRSGRMDVDEYKKWLKDHGDITEEETQWLEHIDDLALITCGPVIGDQTIILTGCAVVATVVLFKALPNFLPRLVIGGAVAAVLNHFLPDDRGGNAGRYPRIYWFGVTVVSLAVIVR